MKATSTKLKKGTKLYWIDNPDVLAGIVIRITPKRDVIINFVSGNILGEHSYPLRIANDFLIK